MVHTNFLHDSSLLSAEAGQPSIEHFPEAANKSWLLMQLERARANSESGLGYTAVLSVSLGEMRECDVARALSRQIGQRLARCVGTNALAVLANSEFAILLENLDEHYTQAAIQASNMAQRVLAEFHQPFRLIDGELICSPGIGVVVIDATPIPVSNLLGNARFAMYRAMAAGKNTVRFYDPALEQALNVHEELKAGLEGDQFVLEYELQSQGDIGAADFEASLQWRHPQYNTLSHRELLTLAEHVGTGQALSEWVLTQVCNRLALWGRDTATTPFTIMVEVDTAQLRRGSFINKLSMMMENAGAETCKLKLRLGRDAWGDDRTMEKIASLKSLGIEVVPTGNEEASHQQQG